MAVTHDDLSLKTHRSTDVSGSGSGRLVLLLVALSIVCGLLSFVSCLAAEGSRTEVTWYVTSNQDDDDDDGSRTYQCVYDGSGRRPLAFAASAFLLLAVAMLAEHAYMLVAVTSPNRPPASVTWTPEDPRLPSSSRALAWRTCLLFLATWISFAIAEVLLMIGMAVESSHTSQWRRPRLECHAIRPGLFAAAGIFGLTTVFLGIALYLTASRGEALRQGQAAEGAQGGGRSAAHQRRSPPGAPRREPQQENPSLNQDFR